MNVLLSASVGKFSGRTFQLLCICKTNLHSVHIPFIAAPDPGRTVDDDNSSINLCFKFSLSTVSTLIYFLLLPGKLSRALPLNDQTTFSSSASAYQVMEITLN